MIAFHKLFSINRVNNPVKLLSVNRFYCILAVLTYLMASNEGISTIDATFCVRLYKKYIGWAVLLNILSAVFNVFSFTF